MSQCWENSDLVKRLQYAVNFAEKTIRLFANDGFSHPGDSDQNVQPGKIIGETATLLLFAHGLNVCSELQSVIDKLAEALIPYARNEKILFNLCLYPGLALDLAHPHICLSKIGYPDSKFDDLLKVACNAHAHSGRERTPYQIIEQEWIRKLWTNTNQPVDSTIMHTLLANPVDLLHGTRNDMYAFTHALIYMSGIRPLAGTLPRQDEEIIDEAEAMVAKCLDEQDYDLTAELLLSWPLMGKEWSSASIFAFRVLAELDSKIGFLPSPSIHAKIPKKLSAAKRSEYLYGTTYHTIYVMGLLCATILKYQWNPPKVMNQDHVKKGSAKRIEHFLKQDGPRPFWLTIYDQLSVQDQDSITSFLFNVVLIRSISRMDYDSTFQLLKLGSELELTNTAMARQSAELIQRVNKLSNMLH